jgi:hypothetical protein
MSEMCLRVPFLLWDKCELSNLNVLHRLTFNFQRLNAVDTIAHPFPAAGAPLEVRIEVAGHDAGLMRVFSKMSLAVLDYQRRDVSVPRKASDLSNSHIRSEFCSGLLAGKLSFFRFLLLSLLFVFAHERSMP